ncbi:hypothetical protein ACP4OV_021559 [Aristida adscensionis]
METTYGSIMRELQGIWDEVGEPEGARDKALLALEQECLNVCRRKVEEANRCRAQLRQAIAESQAELAAICCAMGEPQVHFKQSIQESCGLRGELSAIVLYVEEMRKKKIERWHQFVDVVGKIEKISSEIRSTDSIPFNLPIDQSDLSLRKLEELRIELQALEKQKSERLKQVMEYLNTLHSLCEVLSIEFKQTVSEVQPSLYEDEGSRNISNTTIDKLASVTERLRETKIQRMHKLQDLVSSMLEIWNLMDTPVEEQQAFQSITCNIAASEHEVTKPNALSMDLLNYAEAEVLRLEQLKASKMKDLVLKKKIELEEHQRRAHLVGDDSYAAQFSTEAIEAGVIDPSLLLQNIEAYIATVKEEAFSRKDILERVEKWLSAREEETWLEDYNKDNNRYNAGRGVHVMLRRAEKARVLVNKIPGMVDVLRTKIIAWEEERGMVFTYDGVRLLSMLEEYVMVRQDKEQEMKRQRDRKKFQDQLKAVQETLYGSKPSPSKPHSTKKVPRNSTGGASRKISHVAASVRSPMIGTTHLKSIHTTSKAKGIRGSEFAGVPIKKLSFNSRAPRQMEAPRKPFTQITPGNSSLSTYVQPICNGRKDENRTPNTFTAPTPKTPMTVSAPMQMATTPAPTAARIAPVCLAYDNTELTSQQDVEYSFEERRLAVHLAA